MAYITVSNATVTRTFWNGKGAAIEERYTRRDGEAGVQRYSAFFENEHGLSEGDEGRFNGQLGAKVDEWTDKDGNVRHSVNLTINSTSFTPSENGSADAFGSDEDAPF